MIKKAISGILAIVIISISAVSFATSSQDLKDKQNEIQNKIKETEGRIDEIQDEKDSTQSELDRLNQEIDEKEEEIEIITRELNQLNKEVSELEAKLKEQEEKYDNQYEALCSRMVAQYKMGTVSYLDVLLSSKSLSDFISRYYIIGKVAEYDSKLLEQIETQKREIEVSKNEVQKKQSEVSAKQSKLKLEEITLTNKKGTKNKYLSQLSEEERELQKLNDQLNEDSKKIESELQEIARREAEKANQSGIKYTGGKLAVPCNYTRISSPFGYRGSAATGGVGSSNHKGIDFAAPQGTPIVSGEAGVVIKVSNTCTHNYAKTAKTRCRCGGGYGNYVMVAHGSDLVTLYAHCTSINVSTGQKVARGQQIGTVGCTGYSTGNHLHFSVLLNGTYVNPAPYLGM